MSTRPLILRIASCFLVVLLLSAAPGAWADVFVFKLTPYAGGVPVITLQGPGGTVPGKIDTGAGVGIVVRGDGGVTATGVDPTAGSPQTYGGTGTATGRSGVPIPGSVGPATPPITPPGQGATSPALPGSGAVIPGTTTPRVLLGSPWLNGFHYGRVQGQECDYFFMADKSMGRDGLSEGVAIANFFANPEPIVADRPRAEANPMGGKMPAIAILPAPVKIPRPDDSAAAILNPAPPAMLPLTIFPIDGGWELEVWATGQDADVIHGAPFLLKSGWDTTVISNELAAVLGIDPASQPTITIDSDLGVFTVPSATISLQLVPGSGHPPITVTAAIPDDATNLTGWNYLGSDVLSQLGYWEVSSVEADGQTRLYVAP